jgi:hypothetical protein
MVILRLSFFNSVVHYYIYLKIEKTYEKVVFYIMH